MAEFIFGFDPHRMSDEELFEKQVELSKRVAYAARFSSNGEALDQMMRMLRAIDEVRRERAFLESYEFQESLYPQTTETDPDIRATQKSGGNRGKASGKQKTEAPKPFSLRMRPTSAPVVPNQQTTSLEEKKS